MPHGPRTVPDAFIAESQSVSVPADAIIYAAGDRCDQFILLTQGSVRVDLMTQTGRVILLYRLSAGESCVLTTACLMSDAHYSASASAETDVEASVIPARRFSQLMQSDAEFQRYIFDGFAQRLALMMGKIEEVAFAAIDTRLATRLLEVAGSDNTLTITHTQLANDLGSAREVISRKLMALESDGLLSRNRGSIDLIDRPRLQRLAGITGRVLSRP